MAKYLSSVLNPDGLLDSSMTIREKQSFNWPKALCVVIFFISVTGLQQSSAETKISQQDLTRLTLENGEVHESSCLVGLLQPSEDKNNNASVNNSSCPLKSTQCLDQLTAAGSTCQSEPDSKASRWYHRYIDEQEPEFKMLVLDETLDNRLANLVFLFHESRGVNLDSFLVNKGDPKLDQYYEQSIAGPRVNDERCGRHLESMVEILHELEDILEHKRRENANEVTGKLDERHIRLARILDSFGRYESGVLSGMTHFLGSYIQCQGSQMMLDYEQPTSLTSARYCMAELKVDEYLDASLRGRDERELGNRNSLFTGVCLPETCHVKNLRKFKPLVQALVDSQFKLPKSMFLNESPKLHSVFCSADNDSQYGKISLSGRLLIAFALSWIALLAYITYTNSTGNRNIQQDRQSSLIVKLRDSLDIITSWKDFFLETEIKGAQSKVEIDTFNLIKVIGCALVVIGHAFILSLGTASNLLRAFMDVEIDPYSHFQFPILSVVEVFFAISGTIVTYTTLVKLKTKNKDVGTQTDATKKNTGTISEFFSFWFQISAYRYTRLVPVYFLVFWFKKSFFKSIGSGPMWDQGLNHDTLIGSCQEDSWLTPFLLTAGYMPLTKQCMSECWSVTVDIIASIALGPIIYLFARRPSQGILLAVLFCVVSNASAMNVIDNISPSLLEDFANVRPHAVAFVFRELSFVYTASHIRISAVLVGSLSGYALHVYQQSGDKMKAWPNWLKGPATKISLMVLVSPLSVALMPYLRANGFQVPVFIMKHTLTSGRTVFVIACAIILLRMATDWKDTALMKFCSAKPWRILVKLNYVVLLTHMGVLQYIGLSQITLTPFAISRSYKESAFTYVVCLAIGFFIHVLFENPVNKLVKNLFKWSQEKGESEDIGKSNSGTTIVQSRLMSRTDSKSD